MATVIEYYVPKKLRKQGGKWIPPEQRGRIIPFPVLEDKSVLRLFRLPWPPCLIFAYPTASSSLSISWARFALKASRGQVLASTGRGSF
jgi:hypothetical protein